MNIVFAGCVVGLYILGNFSIAEALILLGLTNISSLLGQLLYEVKKNGSI